jgi:hypothetical protein
VFELVFDATPDISLQVLDLKKNHLDRGYAYGLELLFFNKKTYDFSKV